MNTNQDTKKVPENSVAEVTSTGMTAADELARDPTNQVAADPTRVAARSNMTVAELVDAAHSIDDQATLSKLTDFIVDRDPAEYADNRTGALFLAADIMRNFDVMPKAAQ
jgi:hypothetical protein